MAKSSSDNTGKKRPPTEGSPPGPDFTENIPGTPIVPQGSDDGITLQTARLPSSQPASDGTLAPVTRDLNPTQGPDSRPIDESFFSGFSSNSIEGYEVLGTLGRGGMGLVLKARDLQLNRIVALKLILAGRHASEDDRHRFRTEAEAVARIHHPGIVQIYQVGETAGTPYFALEYMPGGTLADKLDGTPLPNAEAARLIEQLARAMQAAHAAGIVHRDLKPANIFLGADGTPKIGDFGLAKRVDVDLGHTQTGSILGTPSYMAPEQASGHTRNIGTAADVYALGAILYELVGGRPPFKANTVLDTLEQVRSQEPVAPRSLQPNLPRDLETIALKCLHKEPDKRYPSAAALADDCAAFLRGEPVAARPTPAWERAWKWARRRPSIAALMAVSFLALLSLLGVWGWFTLEVRAQRDQAERERRRAEANFERAVRAVDRLLTEVAEDQLAAEPRMEKKRRALLETALEYYNQFREEKVDDHKVRGLTSQAARRVGDIRRLLGQYTQSQEAYRQAIALLTPLTHSASADSIYVRHLAQCHNALGEAQRLDGETDIALENYAIAADLWSKLQASAPGDAEIQLGLARSHYNRGIILKSTDRTAEAITEQTAAVKILEELANGAPTNATYRQELARALLNLASAQRINDFPAAEVSAKRSQQIQRKLIADFPTQPDYQHELGVTRNNVGNLLRRLHRYPEAENAHREAEQLFAKLARDYPGVPEYRKELANVLNSLALTLATRGDTFGALRAGLESRDTFEKLVAEFPDALDYKIGLGRALGNLGTFYLKENKFAEARTVLDRAISFTEAGHLANRHDRSTAIALRNQREDLAEALLRLGDYLTAAQQAALIPAILSEGRDTCQAVNLLTRCAVEAAKDPRLSEPDRKAMETKLIQQALQLLEDAVAHKKVDAKMLENDPALATIRTFLPAVQNTNHERTKERKNENK